MLLAEHDHDVGDGGDRAAAAERLFEQGHTLGLLDLKQQPPHDPAQVLLHVEIDSAALLAAQEVVRGIDTHDAKGGILGAHRLP